MAARSTVFFIGLDAADKDLILEWARNGTLPSFAALIRDSAWAPTANPPGLFAGAIWPSFFTGVSPARHGRYCYAQLRPGTYEVWRYRARDLQREPFWSTLSRAGRRVAVIDMPKTVPTQGLNGIQVVDWATHDPEVDGFGTAPPSLAREIVARFGRDPVGNCDVPRRDAETYQTLRDGLIARIGRKAALTEYLLDQGPWDFFLSVFSETHCAGHHFWHLREPRHPRHDAVIAGRLGDPLKDVYVALDAAVGRLLRGVGADSIAFVLAGDGMGPRYDGNRLLDEVLRRLEHAPLPTRRWRLQDAARLVWRLTPAPLQARLMPLRHRVVRGLEESPTVLDGRLKCFQVPNNDAHGGIRINLVGREPHGRIQPGAEYDSFCAALSRDLAEVVNRDSGRPAFRSVLRTADLYAGPYLDHLPDLLLEWNHDAPLAAVCSAKIGTVEAEFRGLRTGDHRPDGLFFARGPAVTPGEIRRPVSVMDFAPTVAALLGVPLADVDGQPLPEVVARHRGSDRSRQRA